jgi:hypothetical protein
VLIIKPCLSEHTSYRVRGGSFEGAGKFLINHCRVLRSRQFPADKVVSIFLDVSREPSHRLLLFRPGNWAEIKRSNPAWRLVALFSPCRFNTKSKHQCSLVSTYCVLEFVRLGSVYALPALQVTGTHHSSLRRRGCLRSAIKL